MKEVYPDIYMITERASSGSLWPSVNVYVITGSNGLVFDAGYGTRKDIRYLVGKIQSLLVSKPDSSVSRILISHTHIDHFAGLKKLRKRLGVKIIMTEKMAALVRSKRNYFNLYRNKKPEYIRRSYSGCERLINSIQNRLMAFIYQHIVGLGFIDNPDVIIEENTEIDINGEKWLVMHTPGHAVDHISLYDPQRGVLFAGDNILGNITTWLGYPWSDLTGYINTLEKIIKLPKLEVIFASHGDPVTEPRKRIEELIEWRKRRILDVKNVVNDKKENGTNIQEIARILYPHNNAFFRNMARGWIELTIENLVENREVAVEVTGGRVRYFPIG